MNRLYVQLGKTGDLLNLLPLLKVEHERGEKPAIMVSREFAPVLDGVSYIERHIYDGPHHEVGNACELAKKMTDNWCCTQVNASTEAVINYVYGPAGLRTAVTTSFQKESWRVAGKLSEWDNQPALAFDRRDDAREAKLVEHWMPPKFKGKHVLLSLGGVSSPFPMAQVVRELVRAKFPHGTKWNLVDLAEVKAERIYDLLGLYERAHCLIATDSAPLHLARATPQLPVLAFASDNPILWNGSSWRPNHAFYCRYNDFTSRVSAFVWALDQVGGVGFRATEDQQIVHVWSEYEGVSRWPEWFDEYKTGYWTMTPIEVGACGRDSANILKDQRRLPFLKDCLRMGMQRAKETDLVCITRGDTRFRPGITEALLDCGFGYAYRMNQHNGRSTYQPVADLFCAPKEWWRQNMPEIPDMVFGGDVFWPHALWALFHNRKAKDLTGWVWREKAP